MSAGFIEPLEATALVTVEVAANMIARELPQTHAAMALISQRYNQVFRHYWQQIVDFLKLHYVLTERTEEYWQVHRDQMSWTDSLTADLQRWYDTAPWHHDNVLAYELFPPASYQYVLYGMGFVTQKSHRISRHQQREIELVNRLMMGQHQQKEQLLNHLASNRFLLQQIMK
jgi:hypothetical protein